MDNGIIAVIGGDRRYAMLASLLAAEGRNVLAAGFDRQPDSAEGAVHTDPLTAAGMAQTVVFPVMPTTDCATLCAPFSSEEISLDGRLCSRLEGKTVFTGFEEKLRAVSPQYARLKYFDYSKDEVYQLLNAQITAEAAVMLAIQNMPGSIFDSRSAVTGYGRIGRATASLLRAMGGRVTVFARREEARAAATAAGLDARDISELAALAGEHALYINTADAMLFGGEVLGRMERGTVIIDTATAVGVDEQAAEKCGVIAIRAPGLPGKVAPLSAARIIRDVVLSRTDSTE